MEMNDLKSVKRKFDFMMFDDYGFIVDAEKYTEAEAKKVYMNECQLNEDEIADEKIEIVYVKWKPRMSKEDMWYFDIYDNAENRGIYQICPKEDKRAFKCWRLYL